MRTSQYLLSTLKETPAEAVVVSHQLMLRAGLIRPLASGLYNWMPTGARVLKKVENIIREEMNKSGAVEVIMPVVQPAELWQESERWEQYGPELLRFKDRGERDFVLGPTHEEVITDLVRREVSSYKQLPLNLYQIQTKFRDEVRPRFGVMRSREFVMKDAYSFHITKESLQQTYEVMYQTYSNIFTRLGLDFRAVQADTGSIGGSASHEFQVLADSGEDDIVFSTESDYAANIELAEAVAVGERGQPAKAMELVDTPNAKTIAEDRRRPAALQGVDGSFHAIHAQIAGRAVAGFPDPRAELGKPRTGPRRLQRSLSDAHFDLAAVFHHRFLRRGGGDDGSACRHGAGRGVDRRGARFPPRHAQGRRGMGR